MDGQAIAEVLAELDEEFVRVGHPLARWPTPGLDDEEIDRLLTPVGLELPDDARALWRWRGDTLSPTGHSRYGPLPGWLELRPLSAAVQSYQITLDSEFFEITPASSSWFPGFRSGSVHYWMETDVGGDGLVSVTPMFFDDYEDWDVVAPRRVPSLVDIIADMVSMFRRGEWLEIDSPHVGRTWTSDRPTAELVERYRWIVP